MPKKKVALCSPPTATSHVIERLPRRFSRTDSAKAGTWQAYLEQVYGAWSADNAAPDLRSFTWFYHGSPLGTVEPARLGPRCEPLRGHAWVGPKSVRWPESQPALVRVGFFVQPLKPPAPFPNHSFAEVMRVSWPHAAERHGAFHWVARGTGVWLDVGRTYVDAEGYGEQYWFRSRNLEALRGYDTIQFPTTARNSRSPMRNERFEIVDLRAGMPEAVVCASTHYRAGWTHQLPCACDGTAGILNCGNGTPPFFTSSR